MLEALHKEHKVEAGRLVSVSAAPEKARRQADLATADLAAAHQLLSAAETKHMEVESAARGASEHLRQRQVRGAAVLGRNLCLKCLRMMPGTRPCRQTRPATNKQPARLQRSTVARPGSTIVAALFLCHHSLLLSQLEYAGAMSTLEHARIMLEAKDRHSDDISRDVELAGLEKEKILGDQAGVAMAMQVCAG